MQISFFLPKVFECEFHTEKIRSEKNEVPLNPKQGMGTLECWIYQTWLRLQEAGVSCDLVTELPQKGILIVHNDQAAPFLNHPKDLPKDLFIVNIAADLFPHPAAHLNLVQNKAHAQRLPHSIFMPLWPQAHLMKRDPNRGNRFENIHFFGRRQQLALFLQSEEWKDRLRRETGLFLEMKDPSHWHDYSDTDCAIAIRSFSSSRYLHTPSTKLYNAWFANVPFIGGKDSSFAADGHPGTDYLVAASINQLLMHLKHLKEDETFRASLIHQGKHSATPFTKEKILERWKYLLQETLPSLAFQWQKKSPAKREYYSMIQRVCCFADRYMR